MTMNPRPGGVELGDKQRGCTRPGAKNARQAQDNAAALGWRLAEAEIAALDAESQKG